MKHEIKIKGEKPFTIWNDNGQVKQSGWFSLPETLKEFDGDNKKIEAGAYISGMLDLLKIISK